MVRHYEFMSKWGDRNTDVTEEVGESIRQGNKKTLSRQQAIIVNLLIVLILAILLLIKVDSVQ